MPIQCSIKASCKGPKYWIFCVCVPLTWRRLRYTWLSTFCTMRLIWRLQQFKGHQMAGLILLSKSSTLLPRTYHWYVARWLSPVQVFMFDAPQLVKATPSLFLAMVTQCQTVLAVHTQNARLSETKSGTKAPSIKVPASDSSGIII